MRFYFHAGNDQCPTHTTRHSELVSESLTSHNSYRILCCACEIPEQVRNDGKGVLGKFVIRSPPTSTNYFSENLMAVSKSVRGGGEKQPPFDKALLQLLHLFYFMGMLRVTAFFVVGCGFKLSVIFHCGTSGAWVLQ